MNTKVLGIALSLSCLPVFSQNAVDPYMGDWRGSITISGRPQEVVVAMIPLGGGNYQGRFLSTFEKRVPVLFDTRGVIQKSDFKFADAIPFEVSRILGVTDAGVVVNASLWAGKVQDDATTGAIAGRMKGEFRLNRFQRTSPTLGARPPASAVVLFDGSNLDAWQSRDGKGPAKWKLVEGGAMQVSGGEIMTKEQFGAIQLHLEFRTPYMPTASGQGRGNSGVYLMGRYELQVLDSYGLEGADNECGGIYQIARPAVNMCFPPLQWQTYDITFHPARFDATGQKTANARLTVVHNGTTIHNNIELPRATGGALNDKENPPGPLLLQDHSNPVQYRNIWLQKLD